MRRYDVIDVCLVQGYPDRYVLGNLSWFRAHWWRWRLNRIHLNCDDEHCSGLFDYLIVRTPRANRTG